MTTYLGVDLGGTQLRMAAVDPAGRLITEVRSLPTGRAFGAQNLADGLKSLYEQVSGDVGHDYIASLGIGTPGVIVNDTIAQSDNLPVLNGCNLRDIALKAISLPVQVENDANCFALAEARFGAGHGAKIVCGITLGTGIGCGVIIDGRVHHGAHCEAGEVYRIPLRGKHLEYFLAGAGIVRGYEGEKGENGEWGEKGDPARLNSALDAAQIAALARTGDRAAIEAWQSFAEDLTLICECAMSLIDPEVIVIGGSLAQAADIFEPELRKRLEGRSTQIAFAELGTAAGVIGAAALGF